MKDQIVCPRCGSVNKPRAVTCRVCGQRLVERRGEMNREPVVLQRVMTGEVFSAVMGQVPRRQPQATAKDTPQAAEPAEEPGQEPRPPPERAPSDNAEVAKLLRQVLALLRSREYGRAIVIADDILAKRPQEPRALLVKADALYRSGRYAEAGAAFDVLVEKEPGNAKLWLDRARIRRSMQDLPAALESLDRAIALDARLPDAWYERAVVLEALANVTEALTSLAKALELNPDHRGAIAKRIELEGKVSREAAKTTAEEVDKEIEAIETEAAARTPAATQDGLDRELGLEAVIAVPTPAAAADAPAEAPVAPMPAPPRREKVPGRLFTYVEGLDEALNGGIPEGHVVVVAGPPGTLKSSLCASIVAFNAEREGRRSLYVTLEEGSDSIRLQARSLGLPLEDGTDRITILDARDLRAAIPQAGAGWLDAFAAYLGELRAKRPFDLLVLDSLEALEALAPFQDRRREIFRLFEHLRDLRTTALVVAERPDIVVQGNVLYGRWSEDFLADGVLHLRQHFVSDVEVQRRIRVVKMRGTRHDTAYLTLLVDEGRLRATRAMAT